MRTVPLCGLKADGRVALVDDEDYDLVSQYRWYAKETPPRPGNRGIGPYARAVIEENGRSRSLLMHKLITGWPKTDHIDHNTLNNQRHNLRPVTDQQNHFNRLPDVDTSSRYKGLTWVKRHRLWRVQIMVSGEIFRLGRFPSETEAALAYDAAAREKHGEFACLNFPDGAPVTAQEMIRAERIAAGIIHNCVVCGVEYESRRRDSIYCGKTCTIRGSALKRKERQEAERDGRLF